MQTKWNEFWGISWRCKHILRYRPYRGLQRQVDVMNGWNIVLFQIGPGWLNELGSWSLSPIRRGFAPGFVNYKKGCTRFAGASDRAYQLLIHGRWFSPGTPASSTTKTGRHDIAVILLKVALRHQKSINQSIIFQILNVVIFICYNKRTQCIISIPERLSI
jgi:hypothetical protein